MSLRPNFGLYLIYLLIYNVHLFKSVSKHDIITSSDHKSLQSLIARTGVYMKVLLSHSISVYWLNVSYLIQYPCTGWSFVSNAVSMYWLKFRIPCIQYPCTGWSFVDVNYKIIIDLIWINGKTSLNLNDISPLSMHFLVKRYIEVEKLKMSITPELINTACLKAITCYVSCKQDIKNIANLYICINIHKMVKTRPFILQKVNILPNRVILIDWLSCNPNAMKKDFYFECSFATEVNFFSMFHETNSNETWHH